MKWPHVVAMITHYFQLDTGLSDDLTARVRDAVLGDDAKGVPGLDLTPAQVEQLSAEHDDVADMIAALEAKAPGVSAEWTELGDAKHGPTPLLPVKQNSTQLVGG